MTKMLGATAVGGAGIEGLRLVEGEMPTPGAGEALVRLNAATLNYRDLLFATGRLPGMTKTPDYVPLSCAAGVVAAVGGGVERVAPGDRVSPIFALGWIEGQQTSLAMLGGQADGVARQYAVFPAESLVHNPATMSDLEAATMTCAGLTAWNALFAPRPLRAGEWVLCQGTGGVSIAALQFAKAAGAHVAITSSSDDKLARARALGADITVNYRRETDWAAAVRRELGGARIDILVDVVGSSEVEAAAGLLAPGGVISAIGMLGDDFSWERQEIGGHPVAPITVGHRTDHETMLAFCARHAVRPVVDVVYDLSRIDDAYRHLESGRFFGKVGITLL
ncbi:zinc-dependent alcohol dehydrogenase family protein [Sphingomonas solaris]|uniref:NAD(P)-dependent alcohol dehydrogenase n=1 Tax=Alterirhizorhabdus solaris TaxID=2529389 RepID=A0A558R7W7_9SPHN|nr:NAD(P)-dependent alcohol dehydrogenase [Sphingomonas solaris]TVV75467.1 NAD(P)-dependent alcohol dehydrogenase [Sphingomonas solaris]